MMFMASGTSLLTIWISLELMALSSYILAGYFKRELQSNEAALKYFVLGALSSGSHALRHLAALRRHRHRAARRHRRVDRSRLRLEQPGGAVGWVMLAAGLLFKVAAVPFHVWTPDVYVGAPTPITAFLAVGLQDGIVRDPGAHPLPGAAGAAASTGSW